MPRIITAFSCFLLAIVLAIASSWLGVQASRASQTPTKWTPETSLQLKKVGGVKVSPDGNRVVFTVTETVMNDSASEYRGHIHIANADGTDEFQLTQGDKSCDNQQWSPDGQKIAFLSARAGKRNIWLIRSSGGEAERLTDVKTGISSFKWSPDGSMIAYTAVDSPTADEEKGIKIKDDARVVDRNVKMVRLYVCSTARDLAGKTNSRLLSKGDYSVGGGDAFDWAPDGQHIAVTCVKTPSPDDWTSSKIWLVNVTDAIMRPLVTTTAAAMSPLFHPDGKSIACIISDNPPSWPRKVRVCLIHLNGGEPEKLALTYDESPTLVGWSKDATKLFYVEAFHTSTRLFAMPLSGEPKQVGVLADGAIGDVHLNSSRTSFGFTRQTTSQPAEAFVSSAESFKPVRISRLNQDLSKLPTGKTELVKWKSKDGMEIEGLLTYPLNFKKDWTYPLLLVIHGGPAGVFSETFIGNAGPYPIAAFSAEGNFVLRINPRGSSGYGDKFRYANVKDWGGGDYQDLMTGIDHVIGLGNGSVDEKRLGVMGWSYGGFMTSWIITQTNRFKAASVGAGVTNLASFTGTADIPSFLPSYFGGEFWDHPGLYEKHSAMFHVKNVKTPTLIQHGDKDDRVPISQGYELYNALKRQGVTTTMVVYPRMPHGPTEPRLLLDIMKRNTEWMGKYVK